MNALGACPASRASLRGARTELRRRAALAGLVLAILTPREVDAQTTAPKPPPEAAPPAASPRHSIVETGLAAVRLNPLGAALRSTTAYRYRLYDSDHLLLAGSRVDLAARAWLTPSHAQLGPALEVRPLSILALTAAFAFKGYFGTFGNVQAFDEASARYTDQRREVRADREQNFSTIGSEAELGALLQLKAGPVAVRNDLRFFYSDLDLEGRGDFYYHDTFDVLAPDAGWLLTNDADLVVITDAGLIPGVRNHVTHVLGASSGDADPRIVRMGPLLAWILDDDEEARLRRPTVIGFVNWYIQHPFRDGSASIARGVPYVLLVFQAESDLYTFDP